MPNDSVIDPDVLALARFLNWYVQIYTTLSNLIYDGILPMGVDEL